MTSHWSQIVKYDLTMTLATYSELKYYYHFPVPFLCLFNPQLLLFSGWF